MTYQIANGLQPDPPIKTARQMLRLGLGLATYMDPRLTPARIMRRADCTADELKKAILGRALPEKTMFKIANAVSIGEAGLGLNEAGP